MPPDVGQDFSWVPAPWGVTLHCRALAAVSHGWTTRQLPLRATPDIERQGWAAIASAAGVGADRVVRLRQVHGAVVHTTTPEIASAPQADIVVSDLPDQVVTIQVADCAPILTASPSGRVAASHAGWRGTAADVAGTTVRALVAAGEVAASLEAAIGPCIGPCCYRVGEELVAAFRSGGWTREQCDRWFSRRNGEVFLDLWQANADQLAAAGVSPAHVFTSRLCTACHREWFYSYRRDGKATGRLAGYIRAATR